MNILYTRTQTLCHRIEKKINQKFVWLKVASINISRSTVSDRYDNVTLIPLVLQLGLRIGPIQRIGAN